MHLRNERFAIGERASHFRIAAVLDTLAIVILHFAHAREARTNERIAKRLQFGERQRGHGYEPALFDSEWPP